jgi:hypothetical protein
MGEILPKGRLINGSDEEFRYLSLRVFVIIKNRKKRHING